MEPVSTVKRVLSASELPHLGDMADDAITISDLPQLGDMNDNS